jgi:hypothetical protein
MKKKETILIIILLALGLLLRLCISNNPGFVSDILIHKSWADSLYNKGIYNAYQNTGSNLPPVFLYLLYLTSYPMTIFQNYSYLFLKLPGIIVDILLAITIYVASKRKLKDEEFLKKAPMISMAVFLFNPALIFDSAFWGKWDDALVSFFLLLTIYYYNSYKVGAFYALSIFSKLQGIIFTPILFKVDNLHKVIISFSITTLVLLIPFFEEIQTFYNNVFVSSFSMFPHITINAYNFWWLFNWAGWTKEWYDAPSDITMYYIIIPKYFGILVYILVAILLNIYLRKYKYNFRSLCFATFFIYLTFFIFFTRIHERYMYYAFPFLALLVPLVKDRKYLYLYVVLSVTFFLNMYIVYEQNYNFLFPDLHNMKALTITIALINCLAYIYLLSFLIKDIYHSEWQKTNYKLFGFAIPRITNNEHK